VQFRKLYRGGVWKPEVNGPTAHDEDPESNVIFTLPVPAGTVEFTKPSFA